MIIRTLNTVPYQEALQKMHSFTNERTENTEDELWVLQHPPVFTLGQAGKSEHILNAHDIPVIKSDRGGQVTYHGPGQLIMYLLLDLRRLNYTVRALVCTLEKAVMSFLKKYNIESHTVMNAPGVYINQAKICSLGLRIRKGCSFHGLSLNVNMDLNPFQWINPCGSPGLKVVQLSDWIKSITVEEAAQPLSVELINHLGLSYERVQ